MCVRGFRLSDSCLLWARRKERALVLQSRHRWIKYDEHTVLFHRCSDATYTASLKQQNKRPGFEWRGRMVLIYLCKRILAFESDTARHGWPNYSLTRQNAFPHCLLLTLFYLAPSLEFLPQKWNSKKIVHRHVEAGFLNVECRKHNLQHINYIREEAEILKPQQIKMKWLAWTAHSYCEWENMWTEFTQLKIIKGKRQNFSPLMMIDLGKVFIPVCS